MKRKFLIFLLILVGIVSVGAVSATDVTISDDISNLTEAISDDSIYNVELGESDDIDDPEEVDDSYESDDVEDEYNESEELNNQFNDLLIENNSDYSNFVNYLIKNNSFYLDVKSVDFENNVFKLITPKEFTFKLYDGTNYTLPTGGEYIVCLNNRENYMLSGIIYPDIVYNLNGSYYLDEDYLSYLEWNKGFYQFKEELSKIEIIDGDDSDIIIENVESDIIIEDSNFGVENSSIISSSSLPSKYDLRDYGWVSEVKDQGNYGACWSFAAIAALESHLLKTENSTFNFTYDFSENNLRDIMSNRGKNGTLKVDGGCWNMALAYLLRWSGPIYESYDSYGSTNISYEYFQAVKHVQDVKIINSRIIESNNFSYSINSSINNEIKHTIMQYGAVWTNLVFLQNLVKNNCYYCNWDGKNISSALINSSHAITIVGWDDNYSASNFNNKPQADGAFIIKNSWGSDWGDGGYFYISYYDFSLGFTKIISFVNVENTTNYKSIYQYDEIGYVGYISPNRSSFKFCNEFIASNDDTLSAVGFYTKECPKCTIEVEVNGKSNFTQYFNPTFDGYHTVKLDNLVQLKNKDRFKIIITLYTSNISPKYVCVEYNKENYSSVIYHNSSYYMTKNQWILFKNGNFCIKGYTAYDGVMEVTSISASNSSFTYKNGKSLVATLKNSKNQPIAGKNVILTILDKTNSSKVFVKCNNLKTNANGTISWKVNCTSGSYRAVFSFIQDNAYVGSDKVIWFTVSKANTTTTANNLITTFNTGNKLFNVKVQNSQTKVAMSGIKLTLNIYTGSKISKTLNINTDNSGNAKFYIPTTYSSGKHTVTISCADNKLNFNKITKYLTINKAQTTLVAASKATHKYHVSKNFVIKNIKHKNTNKFISGLSLKIKVYTGKNYKTYKATTNKYGTAYFNTKKLTKGTHKVIISSANSNYVVNKTVSITIK